MKQPLIPLKPSSILTSIQSSVQITDSENLFLCNNTNACQFCFLQKLLVTFSIATRIAEETKRKFLLLWQRCGGRVRFLRHQFDRACYSSRGPANNVLFSQHQFDQELSDISSRQFVFEISNQICNIILSEVFFSES